MKTQPEVEISAFVSRLREATEQYEEAATREAKASRDATAALNRLNDAQRAFNDAIDALTKEAPWRSDWGVGRRPSVPRDSEQ